MKKLSVWLLVSLFATHAFAATALLTEEDGEDEDDDETEVVGSLSTGAPARRPFGTTSANVSFTTDYIVRGVTQTENGPALQGGLDWKSPIGIYLGAWGSNVKLADTAATLEVDLAAGYSLPLPDELKVSLGALYYAYFRGGEQNAVDFVVRTAWENLKLEGAYAPKYGGQDGHSFYVTLGYGRPVLWETTVAAAVGYSFYAESLGIENYADFRVSAARELLGVDWEVAGVFVSKRQFNGNDDPRVVLAVSKTF